MTAILYDYWRSSSAYRVRIGLNLAGIPFEVRSVNLLENEQRAEEYLKLNPQGFVPTLFLDGLVLTQSVSILEYLSETRKLDFLPADPVGRTRVRALAYAIAMDIHPICNVSVARYATQNSNGALSTEQWMANFISQGLAAFERMLDEPAAGLYCQGDRVSLADICLVPQLYNARRWGVDLSPLTRVGEIAYRLNDLPEIAAAHPDHCSK